MANSGSHTDQTIRRTCTELLLLGTIPAIHWGSTTSAGTVENLIITHKLKLAPTKAPPDPKTR